MKSVISETKKHIKKFYPNIQDVEVKVGTDADGVFIAKIHARATGKIFHAQKRDENFRRSIDKAFHAIVGQIDREKEKWRKDRHRLAS